MSDLKRCPAIDPDTGDQCGDYAGHHPPTSHTRLIPSDAPWCHAQPAAPQDADRARIQAALWGTAGPSANTQAAPVAAQQDAQQTDTELPPMQPVVVAPDGMIRFHANPIVRALLDGTVPNNMNAIGMRDYPQWAREQFAQLIGYSVSGYSELSYVSDPSYERAAARADELRAALATEVEGEQEEAGRKLAHMIVYAQQLEAKLEEWEQWAERNGYPAIGGPTTEEP